MYDYMKALQKRFDRQPHPDLDAQVEYAQEELRRDMERYSHLLCRKTPGSLEAGGLCSVVSVSYTHLDVYKRQSRTRTGASAGTPQRKRSWKPPRSVSASDPLSSSGCMRTG